MGQISRLRGHILCPRSLTIWAEYAIYEGIDKIPQICRDMDLCGAKWITVEHYGGFGPLHVYLCIYILVLISSKLVVYFMVDML